MKKLLVVPVLVLSIAFALQLSLAAEDKTLNATVTPLVISMSFTPDSISYGTQTAGAVERPSIPTSVTIKNTGTVSQNFSIKGGNSVGNQWTLSSSPGQNQFVHLFSTSNSSFVAMTENYQTLMNGVAKDGDFSLFTQLTLPTIITNLDVQTLPIHIRGTQAP